MQLSQKQITFYLFLAAFLEYGLNFEYFEEKDHNHNFSISEFTDSENVLR